MELRKKKEENCLTPYLQCADIGTMYSYLGFKRDTQFFIGFAVGKWNDETCDRFYQMLSSRLRFPTRKRKVTINTDGNEQNIGGIRKHFHVNAVNYSRRKKIRKNQKIVGVVSEIIFGNQDRTKKGITQIDGFCSKLRERISCFTRKARSFAKRTIGLEQRLEIFSVQHNFMEKKYGRTPAMKEELTSKIWCWSKVLHTRLSYLN